ncbi:ferritin-like domain-containing protein [Evansella sp. LMS18]|uniref:ferritin-like domain-containing protein n=1 Tax=Evansella sp. LMS18 TaxID=2924033 RepID=UPI0020D080A3|nr:ferritin-like domain-containing protein [Evansella sp. LMS18]UTR09893.1 ferritin-like domain-containing protein [Evansella sp. LMS18]
MGKNNVIDTLNEFLRGQYMGIHSYERLIQRLEDEELKKEFQAIQQEHKQHAMRVAERIQNLGGRPVDSEGVMGSIQGRMSEFTMPHNPEGILEQAIMGEGHYGIEISEEIVRGDLDPESRMLIEDILDRDREHVLYLKELLQ